MSNVTSKARKASPSSPQLTRSYPQIRDWIEQDAGLAATEPDPDERHSFASVFFHPVHEHFGLGEDLTGLQAPFPDVVVYQWFESIPLRGLRHFVNNARDYVSAVLAPSGFDPDELDALQIVLDWFESGMNALPNDRYKDQYGQQWLSGAVQSHGVFAFMAQDVSMTQTQVCQQAMRSLMHSWLESRSDFFQANRHNKTHIQACVRSLMRRAKLRKNYTLLFERMDRCVMQEGGWQEVGQWEFEEIQALAKANGFGKLLLDSGDTKEFADDFRCLLGVLQCAHTRQVNRHGVDDEDEPGEHDEIDWPAPQVQTVDVPGYEGGEGEPFEFGLVSSTGPETSTGRILSLRPTPKRTLVIRPKMPVTSQAQVIALVMGAKHHLQYAEKANYLHMLNTHMPTSYSIQCFIQAVYGEDKPPSSVALSEHWFWVQFALLLTHCFGLSPMQLEHLKLATHFEPPVQTDQKNQAHDVQDLDSAEQLASSKQNQWIHMPVLVYKQVKSKATVEWVLHLPIFDPEHHREKTNPNASWLAYKIKLPDAMAIWQIEAIENLIADEPQGPWRPFTPAVKSDCQDTLIAIESAFGVDLKLAGLRAHFFTWVSSSQLAGMTGAQLSLGKLADNGNSALNYTAMSLAQIDALVKNALSSYQIHFGFEKDQCFKLELVTSSKSRQRPDTRAGSSRALTLEQAQAVVQYCKDKVPEAYRLTLNNFSLPSLQARQEYLMAWLLLLSCERSNINLVGTDYWVNRFRGLVFSASKTDRRYTGSTMYPMTPQWIEAFAEHQRMVDDALLIRLSGDFRTLQRCMAPQLPGSAKDRNQWVAQVLENRPAFVDLSYLFKTNQVRSLDVSKVITNLLCSALGATRLTSNQFRHFGRTWYMTQALSDSVIKAVMGHGKNGLSATRSISSFAFNGPQMEQFRKAQEQLQQELKLGPIKYGPNLKAGGLNANAQVPSIAVQSAASAPRSVSPSYQFSDAALEAQVGVDESSGSTNQDATGESDA